MHSPRLVTFVTWTLVSIKISVCIRVASMYNTVFSNATTFSMDV